jgi:hypothetical protein
MVFHRSRELKPQQAAEIVDETRRTARTPGPPSEYHGGFSHSLVASLASWRLIPPFSAACSSRHSSHVGRGESRRGAENAVARRFGLVQRRDSSADSLETARATSADESLIITAARASLARASVSVAAARSSPARASASITAARSSPARASVGVTVARSSPARASVGVTAARASLARASVSVAAARSSPARASVGVTAARASLARAPASVAAARSSLARASAGVAPADVCSRLVKGGGLYGGSC